MSPIRVGVVQFSPVFGATAVNLETVERLIKDVRADILVLPELFSSGYLFETDAEVRRAAHEVEECRVLDWLQEKSRALDCVLVAGIPEKNGQVVYNSAVIVDAASGLVDTYRKVHLFGEEKRWFKPGNLGYRVWDVRGVRVGVMICFDWIFPEAARTLALAGAQVIAHPSNLVLPYGQRALPIRSLENRLFIACANRMGEDRRPSGRVLKFTGRSMIVAPNGTILAEMDATTPGVQVMEIDPTEARDKWITPENHLFHDRRPEFYTLYPF